MTGREDFAVEPVEVVEVDTLQGVDVPARRWLIPDWIPWGAVTGLYGDGGVGKSLLAQQLMTCAASGKPFLGLPVERCKALGVFCEDDRDELHRRQAAINGKLELEFVDLEGMFWWSRVASDNLLMTFGSEAHGETTVFYQQLLEECRARGVQLVVVDTAADVFGGNENARPAVRQFLSAGLGRLARELDGSVLLLAHPSLTGLSSGEGSGGSTAWNNSLRSRLYLSRVAPDDDEAGVDDAVRVLARKKANYASSGDQFRLRYEDGAFVALDLPGAAGELFVAGRRAAAGSAFLEFMAAIEAQGARVNRYPTTANYAPRMMRAQVDGATEYTEKELADAMHGLLRDGRIRVEEDGPPSRRRSFLVIVG